ncbi:MAG: amidohydrolase family protein [Woeseia sp.]
MDVPPRFHSPALLSPAECATASHISYRIALRDRSRAVRTNDRSLRMISTCLIVMLAFVPPYVLADAASGTRAATTDATLTTTDDPRRIRIPPRSMDDSPVLVLRGGTIIDGTDADPIRNGVLVIQGDRIVSVGSRGQVKLPQEEHRVIDVSGSYLIPGLIDLHVHLAGYWKTDDVLFGDSDATAAIRGTRKLAALLDGGITTIRDVGTRNDVALGIKQAVERRIFDGPRVFWAGKGILARGGHGDEIRFGTSASSQGTIHSGGPYARVANGPEDWQLAVRENLQQHTDLIKLFAPFSRSEVASAITEAHMQGIRVTVDAFGKYTTWAVEAGADSIEHTLNTPDEAIELMVRNGTALIPTLTTYHKLLTKGHPEAGLPSGGYYHDPHRSYEMTHEGNLEIVRKAHNAGVKIGVGTDMSFAGEESYPGAYFTEMSFLSDAGMSNREVLESATVVGAEILGMEDKLGTLQEGKLADVLVLRASPLSDIQNAREIELVIADGRVVRGPDAD